MYSFLDLPVFSSEVVLKSQACASSAVIISMSLIRSMYWVTILCGCLVDINFKAEFKLRKYEKADKMAEIGSIYSLPDGAVNGILSCISNISCSMVLFRLDNPSPSNRIGFGISSCLNNSIPTFQI